MSLFLIWCQPGLSASWLRFNIPDPDVLSIMEMHSEVLRYRRLIVIQCCQTHSSASLLSLDPPPHSQHRHQTGPEFILLFNGVL